MKPYILTMSSITLQKRAFISKDPHSRGVLRESFGGGCSFKGKTLKVDFKQGVKGSRGGFKRVNNGKVLFSS